MDRLQTQAFIQHKFAEYYRQNSESVKLPTCPEKREFAFSLFKERKMCRHKGFKDAKAFRNFMKSVETPNAPSHVYYSSAYYEYPEEVMSAKGWLGADLIFDIDADHIPTACNRQHDVWKCKNCGITDHGTKPPECPKCKNQKFETTGWPCDICLESAKQETIKLVETLEEDFGFSQQDINVAFSGHRGYHVEVENEVIRTLDSMARKEIVDYVTGTGLDPTLHGLDLKKALGPTLSDSGWNGRIAKGTYEVLASSPEQLEDCGLKHISDNILGQREQILARWRGKGPWGLVNGVGEDGWKKIIELAIKRQSVKIDTVVTTDVHRLIRMANTLHGETGLLKVEVSTARIETFDPFKEAAAFKNGSIVVDVSEAPALRLGDDVYGPFKNQRIVLPTAPAMFMLCKGAAKIVEETAHVQ